MYYIPLQAVPNQRLSIRLEGALFDITVKAALNLMCATITKNGETLIQGVRCLPSTPLIPYRYLEGDTGNFYFLTEGNSYPDYARFGTLDRLVYLTRQELEEIRHG